MVEHLPQLSIKVKEDKEVNVTSPEPGWVVGILEYLNDGQLLEDREEARKIRIWLVAWRRPLQKKLYSPLA